MPGDESEAGRLAQQAEDCWYDGESGQAVASWESLAEMTGNDLLADYVDRMRWEFEDEQARIAQEMISLARQLTGRDDTASD